MFEAWGRWLYRARRLTLVIALLFAAAAGAWGTGVFGKLDSGNTFTPRSSQSNVESTLAASLFGRDSADVVVLFHSTAHTVADPVYRQAVTGYLASLPANEVATAATFWTSGQPDLVSADRHSTYAVLQLAGGSDQGREDTYKAIAADFSAVAGTPGDGITAQVGGGTPTEVAINSAVSANIARAESISFPVLLILLVIIFGSVVAAFAPLVIGGLAILGSFTVLRLLTLGTTVSVYSVNITTILGLGLGIDYGLFIVTRFREELRRQALLAPGGTTPLRPPGKALLALPAPRAGPWPPLPPAPAPAAPSAPAPPPARALWSGAWTAALAQRFPSTASASPARSLPASAADRAANSACSLARCCCASRPACASAPTASVPCAAPPPRPGWRAAPAPRARPAPASPAAGAPWPRWRPAAAPAARPAPPLPPAAGVRAPAAGPAARPAARLAGRQSAGRRDRAARTQELHGAADVGHVGGCAGRAGEQAGYGVLHPQLHLLALEGEAQAVQRNEEVPARAPWRQCGSSSAAGPPHV